MADSEYVVVTIDGNGGTYQFGNKQLSKIKTYANYLDLNMNLEFVNGNSIFSGYDNNPSCSHYEYGLQTEEFDESDTYYLCWNEYVDGLYYYYNNGDDENNYILFYGNVDNCYQAPISNYKMASYSMETETVKLIRYYGVSDYYLWINNIFNTNELTIKNLEQHMGRPCMRECDFTKNLDRLVLVKHGEVILDVNANDFNITTDASDNYYSFKDSNKATIMRDNFTDNLECFVEGRSTGSDKKK